MYKIMPLEIICRKMVHTHDVLQVLGSVLVSGTEQIPKITEQKY